MAGLILIFITLCDIMLRVNTDDIRHRFFITRPAIMRDFLFKQRTATNMTSDEKFEKAYNKLKEAEGGYTDGKN